MVDNAGVGRSGDVSACTVEDMAEHVWESLDAIGLPKIDLLGFSLGGDVAQHLLTTDLSWWTPDSYPHGCASNWP
jgi:pimeloyl-ACP methyl ester carboxylesterase